MSQYDNRRDTDRRDPEIKTRAGDNTDESRDFIRQRRAYRRMTVVYATVAAGILGLLINGAYYNQGASNNQENCRNIQGVVSRAYIATQRTIDESDDPDVVNRQKLARDDYATLVPPTKKTPLGTGKTCEQQFPTKTLLIF